MPDPIFLTDTQVEDLTDLLIEELLTADLDLALVDERLRRLTALGSSISGYNPQRLEETS